MRETYSVQTTNGVIQFPAPTQILLDKAKLALRITTDAFDSELRDLIHAAELDLHTAGVAFRQQVTGEFSGVTTKEPDPLITRAVVLYCKLYFGTPDKDGVQAWDRLKAAYDDLKAQLSMVSEYRRERDA